MKLLIYLLFIIGVVCVITGYYEDKQIIIKDVEYKYLPRKLDSRDHFETDLLNYYEHLFSGGTHVK